MLDSLSLYVGKLQFDRSEELTMFPLALSIFDTGLLVIIITLMVLYLIILIKLKPSIRREKTLETKSIKQNIQKVSPTEQRNNPVIQHENHEEPAEKVKTVESPNLVTAAPVETENTKISRNSQPSGCPHYFGYLKDHPKNTPIPNECLTCTKIMECLVKRVE